MYCGSMSMRTWGLPRSKAQMTPSGWKDSTSLMNMLKKPKSALVARPSGALMGWRIAWKARCIRELPSMTAMVLLACSAPAAPSCSGASAMVVSAMRSSPCVWVCPLIVAGGQGEFEARTQWAQRARVWWP